MCHHKKFEGEKNTHKLMISKFMMTVEHPQKAAANATANAIMKRGPKIKIFFLKAAAASAANLALSYTYR